MNLSRNGIKLIIDFEGKLKKLPGGRYQAYKCPAGVWTIYTGVTEGVCEGMIVTEAEGQKMFRTELAKFEKAVVDLVTVEINQNQYDSLVSFAYNCGSGALSKSTLLKKVNRGDFEGAAREFAKWNKGGGRVLSGLVRRRAAEAELFLTAPDSTEPVMPQAVDVPAPAVAAASQSSWTIFGALAAVAGTLVQHLEAGVAVAMEAVSELTKLEAVKTLATSANIKIAGATLTIAALALVVGRRLHAAKNGKVG